MADAHEPEQVYLHGIHWLLVALKSWFISRPFRLLQLVLSATLFKVETKSPRPLFKEERGLFVEQWSLGNNILYFNSPANHVKPFAVYWSAGLDSICLFKKKIKRARGLALKASPGVRLSLLLCKNCHTGIQGCRSKRNEKGVVVCLHGHTTPILVYGFFWIFRMRFYILHALKHVVRSNTEP